MHHQSTHERRSISLPDCEQLCVLNLLQALRHGGESKHSTAHRQLRDPKDSFRRILCENFIFDWSLSSSFGTAAIVGIERIRCKFETENSVEDSEKFERRVQFPKEVISLPCSATGGGGESSNGWLTYFRSNRTAIIGQRTRRLSRHPMLKHAWLCQTLLSPPTFLSTLPKTFYQHLINKSISSNHSILFS